jgi:FkbM family methyltransferase
MLHNLINKLKKKVSKNYKSYKKRKKINSIISDLLSQKIEINTIYDIGAYRGQWTEQLYRSSLKNKKFYLFEANHENEKYLKKYKHRYFIETISNDIKEVNFYSKAATGDSYYPEQSNYYKSNLEPKVKKTTTLDLIKDKNNIPLPDFIKIDTQGSEIDILKGATKTIEKCKVILLECPIISYNKGAPNFNQYIEYLNSINYLPFDVSEIHRINNIFVQVDILFLHKKIINDISDNKFLNILN